MAKVYYIVENAPDYSQVNFYKTEKEALEYGLSQIPNFEMGEEPMNDEENDGEEFFHGDELTFKKGILYTVDYGEVEVEAIDEDDAREKVQQNEDAVAIFFDGFTKGMYGYQGTAADGKGYKWDWDGHDINESNTSSTKHKMKHVHLFEQFVNEKAYRLTGMYASKGIVGKVMQAFKKEIERIQLNQEEVTLGEINNAWEAFYDDAAKIIMDSVKKTVKSMDEVLFVHVGGLNSKWEADKINGLNRPGQGALYVTIPGDFVINIGFMDDADASKYKRKFDATTNTPLMTGVDIYGTFDSGVGYNNIEIRDSEFIMIDGK
jgi:hypothetical protein